MLRVRGKDGNVRLNGGNIRYQQQIIIPNSPGRMPNSDAVLWWCFVDLFNVNDSSGGRGATEKCFEWDCFAIGNTTFLLGLHGFQLASAVNNLDWKTL